MANFIEEMIRKDSPDARQEVSAIPKSITPTANQEIVRDIADALLTPPPFFSGPYLDTCVRASVHVGNPMKEAVSTKKEEEKMSFPLPLGADAVNPFGSVSNPTVNRDAEGEIDGDLLVRTVAMTCRNNVIDVSDRIASFVGRAKNAGFAPPANPFMQIAIINSERQDRLPPTIEPAIADQIVSDLNSYIQLLKAESEGRLNFEKQSANTAQISSAEMSFEGFGGSGNSMTDLMKLLPDLDAVRLQKAKDALSVLDFSKRVPKVLFTANYAPSDEPEGVLVGWRRMPDASGYKITRRNIFDGSEKVFALTNEDINRTFSAFRDYVKTWILSFYKGVSESQVSFFLDSTVSADSYYVYKVQAYQMQNKAKDTFRVETIPLNLSRMQRSNVMLDINGLDPGVGDSISPYPFLSKQIFGTDKYDWVLAAVNVKASVTRSEPRSTIRQYSYLHSQLDYLFGRMDEGKFVIPKEIGSVAKSVSDGLAKFGVNQIILEVLQDTGCLYAFDGLDSDVDTPFGQSNNIDVTSSQFLSTVVAAIDPETATINLKSLATNLPLLLEQGTIGSGTALTAGEKSVAQPTEVAVPSNSNNTDLKRAEDEIQYLSKLQLGSEDESVDLASFEGIGKFIRTVRIFSDIGGNKRAEDKPIETKPGLVTIVPSAAALSNVVSAETLVAQHKENERAAAAIDQFGSDRREREKEERRKQEDTGGRKR